MFESLGGVIYIIIERVSKAIAYTMQAPSSSPPLSPLSAPSSGVPLDATLFIGHFRGRRQRCGGGVRPTADLRVVTIFLHNTAGLDQLHSAEEPI